MRDLVWHRAADSAAPQPPPKSLGLGLEDLDDWISGGLAPGDLVVIAGHRGAGATSYACSVAINNAVERAIPVVFISTDDSCETVGLRVMSQLSNVALRALSLGRLSREDWPRLTTAAAQFYQSPLSFAQLTELTLVNVAEVVSHLARANELSLVILDALHDLHAKRGSAADWGRLRDIARERNHAILLLRRIPSGPASGFSRLGWPHLNDCAPPELAASADFIAGVARQAGNGGRESIGFGWAHLVVRKNRRGPTGVVPAAYLEETGRFRGSWTIDSSEGITDQAMRAARERWNFRNHDQTTNDLRSWALMSPRRLPDNWEESLLALQRKRVVDEDSDPTYESNRYDSGDWYYSAVALGYFTREEWLVTQLRRVCDSWLDYPDILLSKSAPEDWAERLIEEYSSDHSWESLINWYGHAPSKNRVWLRWIVQRDWANWDAWSLWQEDLEAEDEWLLQLPRTIAVKWWHSWISHLIDQRQWPEILSRPDRVHTVLSLLEWERLLKLRAMISDTEEAGPEAFGVLKLLEHAIFSLNPNQQALGLDGDDRDE